MEAKSVSLGPTLWQSATFGMPVDEVAKGFPEAVRTDGSATLADGAVADLKLPLLEVASHPFEVLFYFLDGSLTQVTLSSLGRPTLSEFHSLTTALRAKYGAEISQKFGDTFTTSDWVTASGANVSMVLSETIGLLNINFQYRLADAVSKL